MPRLKKIKKTYRLDPITVNTITAMKYLYSKHGYSMSDGEIIERAIRVLFTNLSEEILDLEGGE